MQERGFTLIELSILIICTGLLMTGAMTMYDSYAKRQNMDRTIDSLAIINDAIIEYRNAHGFYPRPAPITLPYGHNDYGYEYDMGSINPSAGSCDQGICRITGNRDADGDGNLDTILIGEVPINTLNEANTFTNIPYVSALDAWEHKIKYVVTESLSSASSTSFSSFNGVLTIEDENGLNVLTEPDIGHYILISHGMNGKGAYDINGSPVEFCTTGLALDPDGNPLPPSPPMSMLEADLRNCDEMTPGGNDFVAGLYSTAENNSYFDDYVFFQAWSARDIWQRTPNDDQSIYSTNIGKVGVQTSSPTNKLHVNGELWAETIYTDPGSTADFDTVGNICNGTDDCGICDPLTPGLCMPPEVLAGNRLKCPNGEAAKVIENNSIVCESLSVPIDTTTTCPNGIKRIRMDGTIECGP